MTGDGETLQVITLILTVGGWILGAIIVVAGMRTQMMTLASAILELKTEIKTTNLKFDDHEQRLGYLEGFQAGLKAAAGRATS